MKTASKINESKQEILYTLTDLDRNTEIYKFFEEDIKFFNLFLSFEKYSKTITHVENLPKIFEDPMFKDLQENFETYVRNKKINSEIWIIHFLALLYCIRPKLLPIIISLAPIGLKIFSSSINEIKNKLLRDLSFYCRCNYFNYLLLIIIQEYFKEESINDMLSQEINIKLNILELFQNPKYLIFCYRDPEFATKYLFREENETDDEFIAAVFQDDYENLISFLTKHPEFNIKSNITKNNKIYDLVSLDSLSPIELCCLFGSNQCFKYFYVNRCEYSSMTNEYTIVGGNYEIIQILIQNNLSFDNCVGASIQYHQYSLSEWLLTNYKQESGLEEDCIICYNFQFLLFIHYNNFHHYDFSPLDYVGEKKSFTFHSFCTSGNFSMVKYLCSVGFDIDSKNEEEETPLHKACQIGFFPIIKLLIDHGSNIDAKDKKGKTPLHYACLSNCLSAVEYLIANGCNIDAEDGDGETPLHVACKSGFIRIVEILVTNGCNKESQTRRGETPLLYAVWKDFLPIVSYLISNECNINPKDRYGNTPLHYACLYQHASIAEILVTNGCDKDSQNILGITPLHTACKNEYFSMIKYLIANGWNKEIKDYDGKTPLNYVESVNIEDLLPLDQA